MAYSLKKLWTAMAVSLVMATSFVGADYVDNQYDQSGSCCPCPCPCPADSCGAWSVSADLLYWQACEDGLAFGSRITTVTEDGIVGTDVRLRNPKVEWDLGFRIGLGYDLPCDGWDIAAYWTHFYNRSSKRHDGLDVAGDVFAPVFGIDPISDLTRARWKLQLNMFDFELGSQFCVSSGLTLRPFVGVRAAWIDQKYDIFTSLAEVDLTGVRLKTRFEGAGIRAGFDTEWKFSSCSGFSLYGQAAAAVLYGEVRSEFDEAVSIGTAQITFVRQRDRYDACRAITDGALGLRWKEFFSCNTIALTLQLGYEHHMFFNQNHFENSIVTFGRDQQRTRGDLCTHGLVFSAKLDF